MTCIAAKDGVMAADGRLSSDDSQTTVVKLIRLPDGGVAGAAGMWAAARRALTWLANGEQGDPPSIGDETQVLIMRPDGSLWLAEAGFPAYPLEAREAAIGSGSQGALVALLMGASALEAVQKVGEICPTIGPPYITMVPEKRKAKAIKRKAR